MTEQEKEQVSIDYVVYLLKEYKPKNYEEASKFLRLEFIDSGAYRATYRICGVPMVIKFPLDGDVKVGKDHTRAEIKAIKTINRLKKYYILRDLMPKIYYSHLGHGVIVMHYYKPLDKVKAKFVPMIVNLMETVTQLIWPEAMKKYETVDIHHSNLGVDDKNNVVFIDLGYFLPLGKGECGTW